MISKKKIRLKILLLLNLIFAVFLIFLTNVKKNGGITEVNRLKTELSLLNQEAGDLEEENKKLEKDIESLKNDTSFIEKIAREELGLVKDGETVFEFVKK